MNEEENKTIQPEIDETDLATATEVDSQPTQEIKIPVKFNKEERELTLDEAKEYAEKGLNYDKVKSRLDELSSSKGLKYLSRLAEEYQTDVDSLVDKLETMDYEERVNVYADENGISNVEHAKKLYKLEQDERARQKEVELAKVKENKDKDLQNFAVFLKDELGLDPAKADIDPEVWRLNEEEGVSLVDAMLRVNFRKEKESRKIAEQNAQNTQASIGNVSADGGLDVEGQITDEWLDKASVADYNRRWSEIQKFLKTKK